MRRIQSGVDIAGRQCPYQRENSFGDHQIDEGLDMCTELPQTKQGELQVCDTILKQDRQCLSIQDVHISQIAHLEAAEYFQKQDSHQGIQSDDCPVSSAVILDLHVWRMLIVP